MPIKVGGRRPSAAAERLYAKLVQLVQPLDLAQQMAFASAIGDGVPFDDLAPELAELLEELARWAGARLVR